MTIFKDKIVLITGGTGSWGQELTSQLLEKNPKEIRIFSRGEINQVAMERKFKNPKLSFIIGDIRDYEALYTALKGVDLVFHLAAPKHVPICEKYADEAIKSNILGVQNLIKASIKQRIIKVIDVSTDKAVLPHNLYGMTKAIGERLILLADTYSEHTRFAVIRGGNALGSNGSAIPHFINQIKSQNLIELTNERMTRYFLTLPEAIGLLFKAVESKITGGIFVMKMPGFYMKDIIEVLIGHLGNSKTKIKIIGAKPGEKINECLVSFHEAPNTYIYNGKYYLIHSTKLSFPKVNFTDYCSNSEISDKDAVKDLLTRGGFINNE